MVLIVWLMCLNFLPTGYHCLCVSSHKDACVCIHVGCGTSQYLRTHLQQYVVYYCGNADMHDPHPPGPQTSNTNVCVCVC